MSAERRVPTPSPEVLKVLDLAARLLYYAREPGPAGAIPHETVRPPRRHAHLRLAAVPAPPAPHPQPVRAAPDHPSEKKR